MKKRKSPKAQMAQSQMQAAGRKARYEAQERDKPRTPEVEPTPLPEPAPGFHRCTVQMQPGNDPAAFISVTSPKGNTLTVPLGMAPNLFTYTSDTEPLMFQSILQRTGYKIKERKEWELANKCSSTEDLGKFKNYIAQRAAWFPAHPLKVYVEFTKAELQLFQRLSTRIPKKEANEK